jgi:predicted MFS family arabinose efflux permease
MVILAEPIRTDLGLSDTEVGALTGFMFALLYTTVGVPVAWFADRADRVRIIALSCAAWSVATAACGAASSFWQLAVARMGVGIGEAGGTPPAFSLLSDYFPPARRAMALALYSLGSPLGIIIGGAAGGLIAEHLGWRMAFVAVGAPGALTAVVLRLSLADPRKRQADDSAPAPRAGLVETFAWCLRTPLMVALSLGAALTSFVGYGAMNWMPALLMRTKAMSLGDVGAYYSWVLGLSLGAGIWAGGRTVDRWGQAHPRIYALAPGLALLAAAPPFIGALLAPGWRLSLACVALPAVLFMVYLAPTLALVQNLAPTHMRATASAILLLVVNLMGAGCGPLFVGVLSDNLGARFGSASLTAALAALLPAFLAAGGVYLLIAGRFASLRRSAIDPADGTAAAPRTQVPAAWASVGPALRKSESGDKT